MIPGNPSLTIFYDGQCIVCSTEILHYKRRLASLKIVDISSPTFKAEELGLDPKQVHQVMHVLDSEGRLHRAVNAFVAIWKVVPGYSWAYRLTQIPGVTALMTPFYYIFAYAIRPILPKRRN